MMVGPFEITAEQVTKLGAKFTPFINHLLDAERAAVGVADPDLRLTYNTNTGDGGVDALFRNAPDGHWVPAGESAVQFKSGSLSPKECETELSGATDAKKVLKGGGNYVVLLGGQDLPEQKIEKRRAAIAKKAVELGLIKTDDPQRIRVYCAADIARWANIYPALISDGAIQGAATGSVDYGRWRTSHEHQGPYSPDPSRTTHIDELRDSLAGDHVEVRVQGPSGIGKTRLVMEALDDDRFRPLVAYVADEQSTPPGLIEALAAEGRTAIIVVDECPADRHVKLSAKVPTNPTVKVLTIGDVGAAYSRSGIVNVGPLEDDAMETLIRGDFPTFPNEAIRLITSNAAGNARWAFQIANELHRAGADQIANVVASGDLAAFITKTLPEGAARFGAAVLAMFERVGWDRDLEEQKNLIAKFAGLSVTDLEDAERQLDARGLVSKQGRYRAVSPAPFAIFLALEGWQTVGHRVVDDLPSFPEEMSLALFRRMADLGQLQPAVAVVKALLEGPFSTLDGIERSGLGSALTQLAIVRPDTVVHHLAGLIDRASLEELAASQNSRRDLVWTLGKLAWHSRTFELAADALLRLALAENETWANNATGTWTSLFGAVLPGTAASSEQRAVYLSRVANDERAEARRLGVDATRSALGNHESIMVSGEVQGGVLVESRGGTRTLGERRDYRLALLRMLDKLLADHDPAVASAAGDALIGAIHPLIEDNLVGQELSGIIAHLTGEPLRLARVEIEHLISLHERNPNKEREIGQRLTELRAALPEPSSSEAFQALATMSRWDLRDGELRQRLLDAVSRLDGKERDEQLGALPPNAPAAWDIGNALAGIDGEPDEALLTTLTDHFEANPSLLLGYLVGLDEAEDPTAFDRYLNGPLGQALGPQSQLGLAVRGPATDDGRERVRALTRALPVAEAAPSSFGWHRHLAPAELAELLEDWVNRVETQQDYNALVDWLNLVLHDETPAPEELRPPLWDVVALRRSHPDLMRQAWDWARLASRTTAEHAAELLDIIFDEVAESSTMLHSGDEDIAIVQACLTADPQAGWDTVVERLEGPEGWRFAMQLRGWVQYSIPLDIITRWIGDSVEPARVVAQVASVGGESPSDLASFLLDKFGSDDDIGGSLSAEFHTGGWAGPWSDHIAAQMKQMKAWQDQTDLPAGVRRWATRILDGLTSEHAAATEREAERGF